MPSISTFYSYNLLIMYRFFYGLEDKYFVAEKMCVLWA